MYAHIYIYSHSLYICDIIYVCIYVCISLCADIPGEDLLAVLEEANAMATSYDQGLGSG